MTDGVTMPTIQLSDLKNLVEYEKAREAMRARVIALKARRRVVLGNQLSLLFESRDTVVYQIQEMMRTERIVDDAKIQEEIDAYTPLLPTPGELSATLFIEIPGISRMSTEQMRAAVSRFRGIDEGRVWLEIGGLVMLARFESGESSEEKMAAVHYVRFEVPEAAQALLVDASAAVRLRCTHPHHPATANLE